MFKVLKEKALKKPKQKQQDVTFQGKLNDKFLLLTIIIIYYLLFYLPYLITYYIKLYYF